MNNKIIGILLFSAFAFMLNGCKKEKIEEELNPPQEEEVNPPQEEEVTTPNKPIVDYNLWEIKDGKFYLDGEWQFLKIANTLRDFTSQDAVNNLIRDLDILKDKNYNAIGIKCGWPRFDFDGDGQIDVSLAPLNELIDSIYAKGMFPILAVSTYTVGGGHLTEGFWAQYPDAYALNAKGEKVIDGDYGFGSDVVSIYHEGYRQTVHSYIKNLAKGIDTKKVLLFEVTTEPQYMGEYNICYSEHARSEYTKWRQANDITDPNSEFPQSYPIPLSFVENATWNKFRAQFLAKWVNDDAAAYREIAGADAYVAVDYLDAAESKTVRRVGDPIEFLSYLNVDVIEVNWTWHFSKNEPNQKAYDRVYEVNNEWNKNWAITEHMTFNGASYNEYSDEELEVILMNTLNQGTRFGWEFVNIINSTSGDFSLYNDDWSPKRVMNVVDSQWDYWMEQVKLIEQNSQR